ncbi:MAG: bifunctional nuclease family protein [Thermomicrobiales bacterium]
MIETVVHSIRVQMHSHHRLVILKEVHGDRHLPIWIGDFEAQAIAIELQGADSPRPLPYDVMKSLIAELGGVVEKVLVIDLSQDVYYARVVLTVGDRTVEIDSRPSDAIALAVRVEVPIFVDESVMDRAGVTLETEDEPAEEAGMVTSGDLPDKVPGMNVDDERLSVFRDFINTLDLDDPERGRGN